MNELIWKIVTDTTNVNTSLLFLERAAKLESIKFTVFNTTRSAIIKKRDKDSRYIKTWMEYNHNFIPVGSDKIQGIKFCIGDSFVEAPYVLFFRDDAKWISVGRVCIYDLRSAATILVAVSNIVSDSKWIIDDSMNLKNEYYYKKYRYLYSRLMKG